mgnify:FL=1
MHLCDIEHISKGDTEMTKFNVYQDTNIICQVWATTADEALNEFAAIVSGYETFSEMIVSLAFNKKYADVYAA